MKCLTAWLALVALVAAAPTAAAHANYLSSDPHRGQQLDAPPREVIVILSERVSQEVTALEVLDAAGTRVDQGATTIQPGPNPRLAVALRPIGPGIYTVNWKAWSTEDGHTTRGSFSFAVGNFTASSDATEQAPDATLSALSRAAAYAGFAMVFGALVFQGSPLRRRVGYLRTGAVLVAAGAFGLAATTWGHVEVDPSTFLRSGPGLNLLSRCGFAALLLAAAFVAPRPRSFALVTGFAVASALATSALGHTATAGAWATLVDAAHLFGAATWVGGLALLAHAMQSDDRATAMQSAAEVARKAPWLVAVLLLSGIASSLVILGFPLTVWGKGPWGAMWTKVLVAKVAITGLMLLLAAMNRWRYMPRGERGAHRLRASAGAEFALGTVVLVLAGVLTAVSPPQPLLAPDGPEPTHGDGQSFRIILVDEDRLVAGELSNLTFRWTTLVGAPVGADQDCGGQCRVRVVFDPPGDDLENETVAARHINNGTWRTADVLLPRPGTYNVTFELQHPDVYADRVQLRLGIRAR